MRMRRTIGLSLVLVVASATAMAKQAQSAHHPPVSGKAKHFRVAAATAKAHATCHHSRSAMPSRADRGRQAAALPPPDEYIGPMQVVGRREIGKAAWYGGSHLGERTASGARLDAIHATAAHRSLPLDSLVRVTNLNNGRSCIVKINDRGPVSHSLLIDVSPRVADELKMKRAGIVAVAVEPVAPAATQAR